MPRQADLIPIRATVRAGQRLIVSTDITRFYHSVYTHSVPWALHGKPTAKVNRSYKLAGNRIDRALRNCRDGQTIGIPIGPDASLIMAELILSEVDMSLCSAIPTLRGLRYVDDYEITFESHDQAEHAVGVLQEALSHFELELNPRKTRLDALPQPHEYVWTAELRSQPVRTTPRGQSKDLVRLFDRAFDFARAAPDEPVLRYLMGRLSGLIVERPNWPLYQHLLLQCITVEPGTLATAAGHLIAHVQAAMVVDADAVETTLNRFIEVHAPLGHHNELAWAIWCVLVLELTVHAAAIRALERSTNPVVILLCLHAEREGRFADVVDKALWQSLMTRASLYGPEWLLAYEALVKGWLPSADGRDYIARDPFFAYLNTLRVRFYLERAVRKAQPTRVPPSFGVAPVFYV
ncbi:MAG: RNA-directed DNA polymerase [Planctomycetota bacterium]